MAHCRTNIRTCASVSIPTQITLRATALLAAALMGGASTASAHALEEPAVPAVS